MKNSRLVIVNMLTSVAFLGRRPKLIMKYMNNLCEFLCVLCVYVVIFIKPNRHIARICFSIFKRLQKQLRGYREAVSLS